MNDEDLLEKIYSRQVSLQRRLGYHPATMTGDELVDYVRLNVLAATGELHEAIQEVRWKPWAKRDGFKVMNRDDFVAELNDVLCFLLNLYYAAGADPTEIEARHAKKDAVNHRRQDEGYTGNDKCEACGRAPDEP